MGKRKNSTKKERTALLKRMGYSESDMQAFWDELVEIGQPKIKLLNASGLTWTDLTVSQIEQLPTLKAGYLQHLDDELNRKIAEEKAEIEAQKEKEYYNEHFEEIMVSKIDKGYDLTVNELRTVVFEYDVENIKGSDMRWTRHMSTIVRLCDRYFQIDWQKGLTEYQEDVFLDQPYEVEEYEYEKTITVKEWRRKCES